MVAGGGLAARGARLLTKRPFYITATMLLAVAMANVVAMLHAGVGHPGGSERMLATLRGVDYQAVQRTHEVGIERLAREQQQQHDAAATEAKRRARGSVSHEGEGAAGLHEGYDLKSHVRAWRDARERRGRAPAPTAAVAAPTRDDAQANPVNGGSPSPHAEKTNNFQQQVDALYSMSAARDAARAGRGGARGRGPEADSRTEEERVRDAVDAILPRFRKEPHAQWVFGDAAAAGTADDVWRVWNEAATPSRVCAPQEAAGGAAAAPAAWVAEFAPRLGYAEGNRVHKTQWRDLAMAKILADIGVASAQGAAPGAAGTAAGGTRILAAIGGAEPAVLEYLRGGGVHTTVLQHSPAQRVSIPGARARNTHAHAHTASGDGRGGVQKHPDDAEGVQHLGAFHDLYSLNLARGVLPEAVRGVASAAADDRAGVAGYSAVLCMGVLEYLNVGESVGAGGREDSKEAGPHGVANHRARADDLLLTLMSLVAPGGIGVVATEVSLSTDTTVAGRAITVYAEQDITAWRARLLAAGFTVPEVSFSVGAEGAALAAGVDAVAPHRSRNHVLVVDNVGAGDVVHTTVVFVVRRPRRI